MDSSISDNTEDKFRSDKGGENLRGIGHDLSPKIIDPSLESTFPIFTSRKTSMDGIKNRCS